MTLTQTTSINIKKSVPKENPIVKSLERKIFLKKKLCDGDLVKSRNSRNNDPEYSSKK